ncbi:biotin carboxylase, partial [Amycolatopsis lurida]
FSIEFFCHPESGQACLLEINPRHSQSHAELFEYVDGVANHQIMVQLGLGQDPRTRRNRGDYRIAGKWYYRRFRDGLVTRVPTRGEIADLEAEIPGVKIEPVAEKGIRLSDLPEQDSYSYELAHIFVAAQTEREMESKYRRCVEALRFDFEEG